MNFPGFVYNNPFGPAGAYPQGAAGAGANIFAPQQPQQAPPQQVPGAQGGVPGGIPGAAFGAMPGLGMAGMSANAAAGGAAGGGGGGIPPLAPIFNIANHNPAAMAAMAGAGGFGGGGVPGGAGMGAPAFGGLGGAFFPGGVGLGGGVAPAGPVLGGAGGAGPGPGGAGGAPAFAGQGGPLPLPPFPAPHPDQGPVAQLCFRLGPTDARGVVQELGAKVLALDTANFDQAGYQEALMAQFGQPHVWATMGPGDTVVMAYGLSSFTAPAGFPSHNVGKYIFLNEPASATPGGGSSAKVPATLFGLLGSIVQGEVPTAAALAAFYPVPGGARGLHPTVVTGDANAELVTVPAICPVPNCLVHIVADSPHPYVCYQRCLAVEQCVPPADRTGFEWMKRFFRACCHQHPGGRSMMASDGWQSVLADTGLARHIEAIHGSFFPAALAPPPPTSAPPATPDSAAKALVESILKGKETKDGLKRWPKEKVLALGAYCGAEADAEVSDLSPFFRDLEKTPRNNTEVKALLMQCVKSFCARHGIQNGVQYIPTSLVSDLKYGVVSNTQSVALELSNAGITPLALSRSAGNKASVIAFREDFLSERSTHSTAADVQRSYGEVSTVPTTMEGLLRYIRAYAGFVGGICDKGAHVRFIVSLLRKLEEKTEEDIQNLEAEWFGDVLWTVHCAARVFFSRVRMDDAPPHPDPRLQKLVADVTVGQAPRPDNVPEAWRSRKRRKTAGGGGGGGSYPEDSGGPVSRQAEIRYHPAVRSAWGAIAKSSPDIKVTTALKRAGTTIQALSNAIDKEQCIIGAITGDCTNPNCGFEHSGGLSGAAADTIVGALKKAVEKGKGS